MFDKHLLYLTSDQVCAYRWHNGHLLDGACFANDAAGVEDFMEYVEAQRAAPFYILADLIEEDFQRVTVPHVGGSAGRKLMQRRVLQQYRETPFRHHEVQGRETGGRRDDIVLLSALTNPGSVQPWLAALEQLQRPLAGLYSTTLLSEELVRRLRLGDEHLLLVTQQTAGWRQSYFHNSMLKFSRLTPAIDRDGNPINVGSETAKTQQFLTSVRLMARGSVLNAVVVTPSADSGALDAQCEDGPETVFRFLTLESIAERSGLKTMPGALQERAEHLAEPAMLALLARSYTGSFTGGRTESHYTLGLLQRYFKLWRARVYLYTVSAIVAACCAAWTGANLWQEQRAVANTISLNRDASKLDLGYRSSMAEMPPSVTSTANMRAAVTVERMLATQSATPLGMTTLVSQALERSPEIQLIQLDWKVNLPAAGAPLPGQDDTQAPPISSLVAGIPTRPPQVLQLQAEVMGEQDDYRKAVDSMNQFAQALARHPRMTVEIDKPPVDTRSSAKLAGKAGAQAVTPDRARFTLKLVWKP